MEYYQRMKDLREDHDLSQENIAKVLQTTQEQVSKYETGRQMMGIDKYTTMATKASQNVTSRPMVTIPNS